ncbi:MAG: PDZ domain-containing protein [Acidimicrobiia bacterium]|nr:PDZ domain-containing protein [Acidimicrobiia bacterium]
MSTARVVAVTPGSPAEAVGLRAGDEILGLGGEPLRDVIAYQLASDEPEVALDFRAPGTRGVSLSPNQRGNRSASNSTVRSSTECVPATTAAPSASSTSCRRGCARASICVTTTTGCRSSTGTSPP